MAWYGQEVGNAPSPPLSGAGVPGLAGSPVGAGRLARRAVRPSDDLRPGDVPAGGPGARLQRGRPADGAGGAAAAGAAASWSFEPEVDGEAFAKLAFRETSLGISGAQRENREGWWAHGQKNRGFIEQAVAGCTRRELAVVFGAGRAFDLPLRAGPRPPSSGWCWSTSTGRRSTRQSRRPSRTRACARASPRGSWISTGINGALVRRLDEILEAPRTADEAEAQVAALCRSYRLDLPPAAAGRGRATGPARRELRAHPARLAAADLRRAPLRRALRADGPGARDALVDRLGRAGPAHPAGPHQCPGRDRRPGRADLGRRQPPDDPRPARAPSAARAARPSRWASNRCASASRRPSASATHAAWEWNRYRPVKRREGARMDVEGVELTEPVTAGGLWLPPG